MFEPRIACFLCKGCHRFEQVMDEFTEYLRARGPLALALKEEVI